MTGLSALSRFEFLTRRDVYQHVLDFLVDSTASGFGFLHGYDESARTLHVNVWSRDVLRSCSTAASTHFPLDEAGRWADCVRERRPVALNDLRITMPPDGLPVGHIELHNFLGLPVIDEGAVVAIVGLSNRVGGYDEDTVRDCASLIERNWVYLKAKLNQVDYRTRHRKSQAALQSVSQLLPAMLGAISRALELRDLYTSRHQQQVARTSELIANEMGLQEDIVDGLRIGATVHDIGKIAVPTEFLTKPGRVTAAEYALLQTHAAAGSDVFANVNVPWPLHSMIRHHHERVDGSGYPDRLAGADICLEARIIAVADVFDAMASDRPYRPALGRQRAVEEIAEGRGLRYDAYVVDAFMACFNRDPSFGGQYA